MHEVSEESYEKMLQLVNIGSLDEKTSGLWNRPPRELRLLVSSLYTKISREPASTLVRRHQDEIEVLDPLIIAAVPQIACDLIRRGTSVDIFGHNGNNWGLAGTAIARIWALDKEIAAKIAESQLKTFAERVGKLEMIDCDEDEDGDVGQFMQLLNELDPAMPKALLELVDADAANDSWTKLIKGKHTRKRCIRSVRTLANIAVSCDGRISTIAKKLIRRFPTLKGT